MRDNTDRIQKLRVRLPHLGSSRIPLEVTTFQLWPDLFIVAGVRIDDAKKPQILCVTIDPVRETCVSGVLQDILRDPAWQARLQKLVQRGFVWWFQPTTDPEAVPPGEADDDEEEWDVTTRYTCRTADADALTELHLVLVSEREQA